MNQIDRRFRRQRPCLYDAPARRSQKSGSAMLDNRRTHTGHRRPRDFRQSQPPDPLQRQCSRLADVEPNSGRPNRYRSRQKIIGRGRQSGHRISGQAEGDRARQKRLPTAKPRSPIFHYRQGPAHGLHRQRPGGRLFRRRGFLAPHADGEEHAAQGLPEPKDSDEDSRVNQALGDGKVEIVQFAPDPPARRKQRACRILYGRGQSHSDRRRTETERLEAG